MLQIEAFNIMLPKVAKNIDSYNMKHYNKVIDDLYGEEGG
jgi:hypothetical protein